ncbi:MAG: hypothetical protein ABR548_01355 [Actinomycetota bacterium]|nr:hypothetical protein [Actinomycetota bacterium]
MPGLSQLRGKATARAAVATIVVFALLCLFAATPVFADDVATSSGSQLTEQLSRALTQRSSADAGDATSVATASSSATGGSADGTAARLALFDTEVLVVGQTSAQASNESSSDATVISVLGNEVIGSHSSADGGTSNSVTGYGHDLCALSEGQLCLALLYGEANSSDSGGSSSSDAYTALAALCAGGEQKDAGDECDGPITAAVGESRSSARNDAAGGTASSESESTVARLCLGDDPKTPLCDGIGVVVLHRDAKSGSAAGEPTGVDFQSGGQDQGGLPHPGPIGDCPESGGGNCLLFNDGDAGAGTVAAADPVLNTGGTSSAHAEGFILQLVISGNEIVKASSTEADTRSGQSSADATVLAVLGHELIGAHAASSGGSAESETGYLTESCDASSGSLCLALLYGHAQSQDGTAASSGKSDTAGASACAEGNQARPEDNCGGPIGLTVAESHSTASQDKTTGAAEATQSVTGGDLCVGGENDEGTCTGLGIVVLHSEAESKAAPGSGSSSGDSSILTVESGGEEQFSLDQPGTIALPPDCPTGGSLVCLTVNDVDTSATAVAPSASATVADIVVVPMTGGAVAGGTGSHSGTNASAGPRVKGVTRRAPPPAPARLPTTGLSLALLLLMSASALAVGSRLRRQSTIGA